MPKFSFIHLSFHLSVRLSMHACMHPSILPSVRPSICLSVILKIWYHGTGKLVQQLWSEITLPNCLTKDINSVSSGWMHAWMDGLDKVRFPGLAYCVSCMGILQGQRLSEILMNISPCRLNIHTYLSPEWFLTIMTYISYFTTTSLPEKYKIL